MYAQSRKPGGLFSWAAICKQPAIWKRALGFALSLALPLISLTPGSYALAACGGGGCSSGGCSTGADSYSDANTMANSAGASMNEGSMQNMLSSMQQPQGASEFPPLPPQMGLHGGILSKLQQHQVEVVFAPKEIRVYLYTTTGQPLPVRGVRGEVSMKIRGILKTYHYTLRESSDGQDQSFLSLRVDATRLREGDMQATFELYGLPSRDEPRAHFVQTFAPTQPAASTPPADELRKVASVRRVATTPEDRPLIASQKTCPITGEPLDSMGGPIKLLVNDQPLFVCCEGCVDQVKSNPTMILAKLDR